MRVIKALNKDRRSLLAAELSGYDPSILPNFVKRVVEAIEAFNAGRRSLLAAELSAYGQSRYLGKRLDA